MRARAIAPSSNEQTGPAGVEMLRNPAEARSAYGHLLGCSVLHTHRLARLRPLAVGRSSQCPKKNAAPPGSAPLETFHHKDSEPLTLPVHSPVPRRCLPLAMSDKSSLNNYRVRIRLASRHGSRSSHPESTFTRLFPFTLDDERGPLTRRVPLLPH